MHSSIRRVEEKENVQNDEQPTHQKATAELARSSSASVSTREGSQGQGGGGFEDDGERRRNSGAYTEHHTDESEPDKCNVEISSTSL